jgi:hypothetical protein
MKKPHLVMAPGEHGWGLRGTCSSCPATDFDIVIMAREESETMLRAAFGIHFKAVHLQEDASQAAAAPLPKSTHRS